jgi:hypothetical protein
VADHFGDFEPEDAWHPLDPRLELVANLFARIALLDHLADHAVRRMDPLEEILGRLEAWRNSHDDHTARQEERARQLLEDLIYVGGLNG